MLETVYLCCNHAYKARKSCANEEMLYMTKIATLRALHMFIYKVSVCWGMHLQVNLHVHLCRYKNQLENLM